MSTARAIVLEIPAPKKEREADSKRNPRGVYERVRGSGVWWICYFDQFGKKHREKAGTKSAAILLYRKRKQHALEGKKLPEKFRSAPLTFGKIADYALEYSKLNKRSYRTDVPRFALLKEWFGNSTAEELTPTEIENRLAKAAEEQEWAASTFALHTGLRKGSQYGLTWDMVNWKTRMLSIPRTKNEEPLHLPLNDSALAALKLVFEGSDRKGRVFKSAKTGDPLENGRHWFDDAMAEAKLKNFHWHDLRHTFASRLRMKGTPLEDIADLLGHKSLTMTRRYAHLGPNRLHEVVSRLGASDTRSDTAPIVSSRSASQVAVP